MVVQHNLRAMNSNRMLGITTKTQSKSTEKLSSGYKINRAADDAAGLSISEKMRKQIRGLTQASLNAQDGISAVQTAEGALTEVHDMLQRMNELAVKAANGTNSSDDRGYIQKEVDQLISEINRVAETTKFNETYLLKGEGSETKTVDVPSKLVSLAITEGKEFSESYTISGSDKFYAVDGEGKKTELNSSMAATVLAKYINADGSAKAGYAIYASDADTSGEFGNQIKDNLVDADTVKDALKTSKTGLMDKDGKEVKESQLKDYFDSTGVYKGGLYSMSDTATVPTEIGAEQISSFVDREVEAATTASVTTAGALTLSLHVGADGNNDNKITLDISSMSADGIGVSGLKVDTEADATASIETLKSAIQKVSEQRSMLGAIQNRLEHTINNLDNVVENTTSAEAQIRDTDMATEMVKYSNNNILAQAGQAMLAQSNQANQGVLSLLG